MGIFKEFQQDKEIQDMIKYIRKETGEYEGLMIWEAETIDKCRERLRKEVEEIKQKKNR